MSCATLCRIRCGCGVCTGMCARFGRITTTATANIRAKSNYATHQQSYQTGQQPQYKPLIVVFIVIRIHLYSFRLKSFNSKNYTRF